MKDTVRIVATIEAKVVSGAAKAVLEFAREAKHDPAMDISLLLYHRGKEAPVNALTEVIARDGLSFDVIHESSPLDMRAIAQMRRVLDGRKATLLWTNSIKSHFLARIGGLNRSRPWIAFHHGYTTTDTKMLVYNQLDRLSLPAADGVLTVCRPFATELESRGVQPSRIRVQHMPVRPFARPADARVLEVRERFGIAPHEPILLTVGRLSREKGHADLLRAVARLVTGGNHPHIRLLVVGDGPEAGPLRQLTEELGLTRQVAFAGQQNDPAPFYAAAAMYVLPSHSEGSPNVLLEAYAAGLPVVATAVGGVPEMAADGVSALLVRPRDPAELALAIARLLSAPPELRDHLTRGGREVAEAHSPVDYYRALSGFFTDIASS